MRTKNGRTVKGSFWPSDEQRLLLESSFLPDERARESWEALRPNLDIRRLEFGTMAVLPLLYERLVEWNEAPSFVSRLKGIYRYVWYGNQVALRGLASAVGSLQEDAVESLVLGGAALVCQHYRRLGVRAFAEGEILVRDVPTALETLAAAGWQGCADHDPTRLCIRRAGAASHDRCLVTASLPSELELGGAELYEEIWSAREEAILKDVTSHAFGATHELLLTIVTGARSGGSRVQWVADSIAILRTSRIDWEQLHRAALRCHCILRVRDALIYLADELDAPVPWNVVERLEGARCTRRERLAHWVGGHGSSLGMLPATVANHLVSTQQQSLARALLGLPRHLVTSWGLAGMHELPGAMVRKSAAAIGRARGSRHEPMRDLLPGDSSV